MTPTSTQCLCLNFEMECRSQQYQRKAILSEMFVCSAKTAMMRGQVVLNHGKTIPQIRLLVPRTENLCYSDFSYSKHRWCSNVKRKYGQNFIARNIRGMFFNTCHLLDYFFCGQSMRMLFICGESPIFSDQIGIKIIAVRRTVI